MLETQEIQASSQVLIFTIGKEEYGIDIKKVQEIRGKETVTGVPGTRAYQKGVINLRGTIVPIIDLRIKFRMPEVTFDDLTTFIIVTTQDRLIGIIVDRVSDVVTLEEDDIKPVANIGSSLTEKSVKGFGTIEDRMIVLLDIEEVIGAVELLDSDSVID